MKGREVVEVEATRLFRHKGLCLRKGLGLMRRVISFEKIVS